MNRRRTDWEVDWFRVAVILGLGALLIWLFLVLGRAHAGEAIITWTAPTKNCDGTSLTDLTGYSMIYGQGKQELGKVLTTTVPNLAPGKWFFSLAAVTPTERSEFVTAEKTILPADFKTTSDVIYTLVKRTDRIVMLPVGTAPVGTICDATQSVNGYYVVPRASVTWSALIRPDVVFASCG